ncbi:MAG TPA: hypothetical protein VFG47_03955 [Geminicoccaceae bacterium]|nr:hypothetical protein [Geminicoccaceae bacterium]
MRILLRLGAGAFLLAAAVMLRPAGAADATHPLDPNASPGVLPTGDPFLGHVPLLDREAPAPSFAAAPAAPPDGRTSPVADWREPWAMPAMRHVVMRGGGGTAHGAHTTATTTE